MATGVADCYYNVVDLPAGVTFRFRVACVNKAGQGPYSNLSEVVSLDVAGMYNLTTNQGNVFFDKSVIGILYLLAFYYYSLD